MNVLLLGDSHTHGTYGQTLEGLFKARGDTVTRVGVVSVTAGQYLSGNWKKLTLGRTGDFDDAIAGSYDLAVISLGTNDAAGMGADASKTAQTIKTLAERVKAPVIWWVGPPAFSDNAARTYNPVFKTEDLNSRAERLWKAASPLFEPRAIDPREATKSFVEQSDIHFKPAGGKAWAQFVFDRVLATPAASKGSVSYLPYLGLGLALAGGWFWWSKRRTAALGALPKSGPIPAASVRYAMQRLKRQVEKCDITEAQLREGMAVEREHGDVTRRGVVKTAKIAAAHLCEAGPRYYPELKRLERRLARRR